MKRGRVHPAEQDRRYVALAITCRAGHPAGLIVRQRGEDQVESPMERIYGPNGESKVQLRCRLCNPENPPDSQVRWDRIAPLLDALDAKDPDNFKGHMQFP